MLFISETGVDSILNILIGIWNGTNVSLHLFQNAATPSFNSVIGDFVESNFPGYAPVDIAAWILGPVITNVGYMQTVTPCVFTVSSGAGPPQLAYGYYVLDDSGNLLWAELDPNGPTSMSSSGNQVQVFARLGLSNCPP